MPTDALKLDNGNSNQFILHHSFLKNSPATSILSGVSDDLSFDQNSGSIVHCRRYHQPAVDITPANGQTNKAPVQLEYSDFTATLDEFNEAISMPRRDMDLTQYKESIKEQGKILATHTIPTIRELYRFGKYRAGTNRFYNSTAVSSPTTVNGAINANALDRVARALLEKKAMPFFEKIGAVNATNTSGVPKAFKVVGHTDLISDWENLPGFKTPDMYAAEEGEVGAWKGFRFFAASDYAPTLNQGQSSSTLKANGASGSTAGLCDVYTMLIFGKSAVHALPLKTKNGTNGYGNVKTQLLDKGDKSDLFNKLIISTAQYNDVALITCQEWMASLEVGANRL